MNPPEPEREFAAVREILDAEPEEQSGTVLRFADLSTIYDRTLTAPPWVYEGWLTERDRVVFTGTMYTGKSFVAADLAISLASGKTWLGMEQKRGPFRVVYLDKENPPDLSLHYRLPRMLAAAGITDPGSIPLHYSEFCGLTLEKQEDVDQALRALEPLQPDWIIADTLIRFHRADENSNSEMAYVMGMFDRLGRESGAGVVVQAHAGKADAGGIRGASDIGYSQNTLWTLERDKDSERTVLRSKKVRWGEKAPDIEIEIEDVPHLIHAGAMTPALSAIAVTGRTCDPDAQEIVDGKIRESGADGITQATLVTIVAEELDLKHPAARQAVHRVVKRTRYDQRKEGKTKRLWTLGAGPVGA